MKILNFNINSKIIKIIFLIALLNNFINSQSESQSQSQSQSITNQEINNSIYLKTKEKIINKENIEKINRNKAQKKTKIHTNIRKNNKIQKIKSKEREINVDLLNPNESNKNVTEEELQLFENMKKIQQKNDSFMYASWFIFVPLVLLIFIMTILSITGFLILILNSTNTNNNLDKKEILRNSLISLNRSNLSNQEILDILRKQNVKKNKNKNKSHVNYKPEPEPETILLGM
jgi:hypothetical protein